MPKHSSKKLRVVPMSAPSSALATPSTLPADAVTAIATSLNTLLANVFAVYMKTKNFHWHMSGPHFRDYHILLDEHAEQIYAIIDPLAERVRKLGAVTLRSISHISKLQTIVDNNDAFVGPNAMLAELIRDNKLLVEAMRRTHDVCDKHGDVATTSLLEGYIEECERRIWFLFESNRNADPTGH